MKTTDWLLLGGAAIGIYYLFIHKTAGVSGSEDFSGPGSAYGSGGPAQYILAEPPTTGAGSAGSPLGLLVQRLSPNPLINQETLFFGGQGYSVSGANANAMVTQLRNVSTVNAPTSSQQVAVQAAQVYYAGGPPPSIPSSIGGSSSSYVPASANIINYPVGTPSDVMTGMSIRLDSGSPFKNLPSKPVGFK
jgi:hypothetical protein